MNRAIEEDRFFFPIPYYTSWILCHAGGLPTQTNKDNAIGQNEQVFRSGM